MASPAEKVLTITCPGCAGRFRVPASAVGRRGRCARCGAAVIIVAPGESQPAHQAAMEPAALAPQYIPVECRVCQTLMYGRPDQVGGRLKCPDCGALTVVPPPPKPKLKRPPPALEGAQYEVWDADQQPLPSELKAAEPVYIAVVCRECETLMYATVAQVGHAIKCPDCGSSHVVPPPPEPVQRKPLMLDEAYAVDPAADPGERPPVIIPPTRKLEFEEREEAEYARALEKSRRTGKPIEIDARGRRIMPRWPLVTGVVGFLFSRGVPVRWIALSIVLSITSSMFLYAMSTVGAALGSGSIVSGGLSAISAMCAMAAAVIIGMLWASAAAGTAITIITESSEGNDHVQQWPSPNPAEWFAYLLYVAIAVSVTAFPGWLAAQLAANVAEPPLWVALSAWLLLPLVLLSQLEISSPWAIVSGKVLRSYLRRPVSWLLLYVESALLAAGCVSITIAAVTVGTILAALVAPVYVAAGFVYSRLLGRLAWCIAESGESGELRAES